MESAMRTAGDKYVFRVRWLPFLLRPDIPKAGFPKPANTPGNPRVSPRLKQAGEAVGIDFTGKADKYPNTVSAHALLEYAKKFEDGAKQNDLAELLFKAYFTDGQTLEPAQLLDLAVKAGLDKAEADQVLASEEALAAVHQAVMQWNMRGISGVPTFYMNDQKTFSGAQDAENFLRFFDIINTKYPLQEDGTVGPPVQC